MKDNRTKNLKGTADGAAAQEETAAADLGKFKDVKTLLSAYQALEAEFTRRSQRLKELEANKGTGASAEAGNAQNPSREEESAEENKMEISEEKKADESASSAHSTGAISGDTVTTGQKDKNLSAENAPAADENSTVTAPAVQTAEGGGASAPQPAMQQPQEISEEVRRAVIEEYLNGVFRGKGVPFVTGGGAVAAKRRTPTTLKEAGVLAGKLFNNKEEN